MRELQIGTNEHTTVAAVDVPSHGGACHEYVVIATKSEEPHCNLSSIHFQKGPIQEHGVNGIHNEDLIAIVIDRLQGFQAGEYACDENALALTYLEGVLGRLRDRTDRRKAAGIEGTSKKDPVAAEAQEKVDKIKCGGTPGYEESMVTKIDLSRELDEQLAKTAQEFKDKYKL